MRHATLPLILVYFVLVLLNSAGRPAAAAPPSIPRGDFNDDGKLDASDIDALTGLVRSAQYDAVFDLNDDSVLDQEDRRIWVEEIAQTYFGDSNLNGVFNTGDLVRVFQDGQYEDAVADNSTWQTGDWDGDGDFTTSDMVLSFQSGAFEGRPRLPNHPGPKTVPEPSAIILFSLGGLMWHTVRRRG